MPHTKDQLGYKFCRYEWLQLQSDLLKYPFKLLTLSPTAFNRNTFLQWDNPQSYYSVEIY